MTEKLKSYVEKIFENAPKTKKVYDLKEEIISNLIDKYNDLKESGKTDEESYNIAISNIGDISELVNNLKEDDVFNITKNEERRKKSALFISIAVGLYIFSFIPVIFLGEISSSEYLETIGIVLMFFMWGIATMLLVYNGVSKPKYKGIDDSMVEEFKEWKSKKENKNTKKSSIKSAMWSFIVAIYFIISFMFMAWAYSWIIFLIGASVSKLIDAIYEE